MDNETQSIEDRVAFLFTCVDKTDFYAYEDGGSVCYLGDMKVIIQSRSNLSRVIQSLYMIRQLKGNFYERDSDEIAITRACFDDLKKHVELCITKVKL